MVLKPLNDTLIIELGADTWWGDAETVAILKRGLIVAPEHNTVMKRANSGKIISWGKKCKNSYRKGQNVLFRYPSIVSDNGYRMIVEEQVLGVEDD